MSSQVSRVFVIANQKGGVGKTTTAINLSTAIAAVGKKVLIVDLDPQGNASTGLGIKMVDRVASTYDILRDEVPLFQVILQTNVPGLYIAPATLDLLGLELEIADCPDRAYRLRKAIKRHTDTITQVTPNDTNKDHHKNQNQHVHFDYIIIDCPPSLNLLTLNGMAAANAIIVPLQCEFFALEGLSQLLTTIKQIQQSINPTLCIHGIILTMFDARNKLAGQVVSDVRKTMGDSVYETVIPRNVRISEAPSHGKPALIYDLTCSGSQAYLRLASEVLRREERG